MAAITSTLRVANPSLIKYDPNDKKYAKYPWAGVQFFYSVNSNALNNENTDLQDFYTRTMKQILNADENKNKSVIIFPNPNDTDTDTDTRSPQIQTQILDFIKAYQASIQHGDRNNLNKFQSLPYLSRIYPGTIDMFYDYLINNNDSDNNLYYQIVPSDAILMNSIPPQFLSPLDNKNLDFLGVYQNRMSNFSSSSPPSSPPSPPSSSSFFSPYVYCQHEQLVWENNLFNNDTQKNLGSWNKCRDFAAQIPKRSGFGRGYSYTLDPRDIKSKYDFFKTVIQQPNAVTQLKFETNAIQQLILAKTAEIKETKDLYDQEQKRFQDFINREKEREGGEKEEGKGIRGEEKSIINNINTLQNNLNVLKRQRENLIQEIEDEILRPTGYQAKRSRLISNVNVESSQPSISALPLSSNEYGSNNREMISLPTTRPGSESQTTALIRTGRSTGIPSSLSSSTITRVTPSSANRRLISQEQQPQQTRFGGDGDAEADADTLPSVSSSSLFTQPLQLRSMDLTADTDLAPLSSNEGSNIYGNMNLSSSGTANTYDDIYNDYEYDDDYDEYENTNSFPFSFF
jgi:hypothetical protein